MKNIIALIWPSWAGKTSFWKPLAKEIWYDFLDFDDDILQKINLDTAIKIFNILNIQKNNTKLISPIDIINSSVSSIKDILWDENFMRLEWYLLKNLNLEEDTVLATSWSLPLAEWALDFLNKNCINIYLKKNITDIKNNFPDMKLDRIVWMPSNINELSKEKQEELYDEIMVKRQKIYEQISDKVYNIPKQINIPKNKNWIEFLDKKPNKKGKKDIMIISFNKFFDFIKKEWIVQI